MCTTPQNECCLSCDDVSTSREHDLLMATMEGLTHHILDKNFDHSWLRNRAWQGNSHIGNRPEQAVYYYDWTRSLTIGNESAKHVCEVGMNGGHSALIFLAALTQASDRGRGVENNAKLTMFDMFAYKYSQLSKEYIEALYPRRFVAYVGDSAITLPQWTLTHEKDKCDVFSIDGDHKYEGAKRDILNAAKATRKGGMLILDDMNQERTRRAFDEALAEGVLAHPKCMEDVLIRVGYADRSNETNARELRTSWCTASVV